MDMGLMLVSMRHAKWAFPEDCRTGKREIEQFGVVDCGRKRGREVLWAVDNMAPLGIR